MHNILIFGGTFDPIHNGHINVAIAVQKHFDFERFIFLPCKTPVLKNNSQASAKQRLDMLHLVLQEHPSCHFEIDPREINRESPSYMVTTLEDYRFDSENDLSITLLIGRDTFEDLPRWYNWKKLLLLANLLVIDRPGSGNTGNAIFSSTLLKLMVKHETRDSKKLKKNTHGVIYRFNAGMFDYSSTSIRLQLGDKQATNLPLPTSVENYIKYCKLYTKK